MQASIEILLEFAHALGGCPDIQALYSCIRLILRIFGMLLFILVECTNILMSDLLYMLFNLKTFSFVVIFCFLVPVDNSKLTYFVSPSRMPILST